MNNKKLWLILFALVLVLAACGQNQSNEKGHQSTHSTKQETTDHNNNSHTYHRIISLMPSNTEILYRLGIGKNIIGVSTVDDYPKNVKKGTQQFDAMNLNKEALLKAKPDLILAHESQKSSAKKTLDSLADSGVKVVYIKDAQSLDQVYHSFEQVGKVTHRENEAKQLVKETKDNVKKVIYSIQAHHTKKRNFIEV